MSLGFAGVLVTMFSWWKNTINEAHSGYHTPVVQLHLRYGMILFIASEVMFFLAWFWAFFDSALFPVRRGCGRRRVAAQGHRGPQPVGLPAAQYADPALLGHDRDLGPPFADPRRPRRAEARSAADDPARPRFTSVQAYEYAHAPFAFKGSIYGSTFFMATGFHGFHVIVGTIFLIVCLVRANKGDFTPRQHFGFEAAAWYWHFVDVVWLFLFISIYVWGGWGAPHAG